MQRLLRLSALFLVSLLVAAPVAAHAQEEFSFKYTATGTSAQAQWGTCEPDTPEPGFETCEVTSVNVRQGTSRVKSPVEGVVRGGSSVCVYTETYIQSPESFETLSAASGCTETFSLTVAPDLSTAHLVATVPVFDFECREEPPGEFFCEPVGAATNVAVDVTWTALEPAATVRERGTFQYLDPSGLRCKSQYSRRGLSAFSTATGSVGGVQVGEAEYAEIFSGRMSFADSCR